MRPFRGETATLQRNAVRSWLAVRPACDIILIDDEADTTREAVRDLPVRVVSDVTRSGLGVPLFDSMLEAGASAAMGDILVCTTADVLFPPNFAAAVSDAVDAMEGGDYLLVIGRRNLTEPIALDLTDPDWCTKACQSVKEDALTFRQGIDTWIYPTRVRLRPPPFPIGRHGTDGWAVYEMKRRGVPVIDLTPDVTLLHQHHAKMSMSDPRFYQEMRDCVRLFDGMAEKALNLLDADWIFSRGRLRRPRGLRRLHAAMSLFRPYRYLLGLRRRILLPHLYGPEPHAR